MRRAIAPNNPFREEPRFAFAYEHMKDGDQVLDYGCHDGAFGHRIKQHKAIHYVGIDKNSDAVRKASNEIRVEELRFPLPFADESFDVVTILEVLEHVHDQDKVLSELWRVLKPSGTLIVSTPRKHFFSFLDLANFKFMFPGLHRLYYTATRSREEYDQRYSSNPNKLVGDIEIEKRWHQHFTDSEMTDLIHRNGFRVTEMDGSGLFTTLFTFINHVLCLGFIFRKSNLRLIPGAAYQWDVRTFHYASVFCAADRLSGTART